MNINKFTQKSLQAVQDCEKTAMEYGNQEIEQEHLLYALLTQEDGLILKMMEKMGLDKNLVTDRVEQLIAKRPKVQGGQPYVGQYLNKVLTCAEDEMKQMGDQYVSVEHLFLAMLKYLNREIKQFFRERIRTTLRISLSRPMTGSSFWSRARSTRSVPDLLSVS